MGEARAEDGRHMRRLVSCSLLVVLVACGGGGGGGTPAPTPTPTPPTPPADNWVINGQVVAYGTNTPVAGARVAPGSGSSTTADGSGNFRLSSTQPPSTQPIAVKVEADGHITRDTYLRYQAGTRDGARIDLIRNAAPFSLSFFNALVRGEYHDLDELTPVLRLQTSPKFYVRTIDQNGRAVEPEVLNVVLPAIRGAVTDWTSGMLSVSTLETGTQTRPRTEGWIVVNITRNYSSEYCGAAYVGSTQGEIELVNDRCNCGSNKISGAIVAHEVGHALGFWHVSDRGSLMYPYVPGNCPPGNLSASERYHSALAYSRTRGNMDPDKDQPDGALATAEGSGADFRVIN
jgi:Matrixin